MMCEMNPDTKSSKHVVQSSADFIAAQNGDFTQYSLVIATQLPSSTLRELGNACTTSNVPMLVVRTYGLIGYVRVVLPRHDHPIVQDHKTNDTSDQWITNPWENLTNWRNSFNLDTQNSIEHMHTPWPVILHHILGKYKEEFGEEKYIALNRKTLGDYVMQFSMNHRMKLYEAEMKKTNSPSSDSNDDEHDTAPEDPRGAAPPLNYMEAKSRCYKALTNYELPYGLKDVLSDPRAGKNQESSTANINNPASGDKYMSFWIIMQAVNRFIEKEGNGFLPVTGTVVDLTASSCKYRFIDCSHYCLGGVVFFCCTHSFFLHFFRFF
jgi:amyloid beta precursor protein binding protein 1